MNKSKILSLMLIGLFGFLAGCSQTTENENVDITTSEEVAVYDPSAEYNNNLTDIVNVCNSSASSASDIYNKYKPGSSITNVENEINNAISACENSADQINSLGAWEGDSSLKDAAIIFIDKVVEYLTLKKNTLPYLEKNTPTQQEISEQNAIVEELKVVDIELNQVIENLMAVQKDFAQEYDLSVKN